MQEGYACASRGEREGDHALAVTVIWRAAGAGKRVPASRARAEKERMSPPRLSFQIDRWKKSRLSFCIHVRQENTHNLGSLGLFCHKLVVAWF